MPIIVSPNLPANAVRVSLHPPHFSLPLYGGKVSAAQSRWASAAQDYMDDDFGVLGGRLDLNVRFVTNPPSTFVMPVDGDSMIKAGLFPGTIAIIDKNADAKSGSIVVVWYGDKYIVKRLYIKGNIVKLRSEHPNIREYPPLLFKGDDELMIWGVVKHGINTY